MHREYGARNPRGYEGYDRNLWGITAGDGPVNRAMRQGRRARMRRIRARLAEYHSAERLRRQFSALRGSPCLAGGGHATILQKGHRRHWRAAEAVQHSGSGSDWLPHQRFHIRSRRVTRTPGHHRRRPDFDAERGIRVDNFLRTTNADVYAAGDVCDWHHFTNVAERSAHIAVQNAFGAMIERPEQSHIPWCAYCDPEIAHIGINVREANLRSIPITSFTVMMQDVDRAITDGQDDGFVKIYVKDGSDEILGATVVAARAGELINEISVIMSAGIGMRRLATILHTYPTQSDAIRLAAVAYVNHQSDLRLDRWSYCKP